MSDTMLAGRMNFRTKRFSVMTVPVPNPGPGEVRVQVKASGVCSSDAHLMAGLYHPLWLSRPEVTLGHEVAGVVDALGPDVEGVPIGQRVVLLAGKEVNGRLLTLGANYDGGWAEYVVTPASTLVPIPDSLPYDQACIIPDAVSTPWGAITGTAKVRAEEAVGVWGIGGLGAHAIQLLRFVGAAPIIAVDPEPGARRRALEYGADLVLDPAQREFRAAILGITNNQGLAVAIDLAGVAPARKQALSCVAVGGRLVLAGISGIPVAIENDTTFAFAKRQILGHYGSEPGDVPALVKLTQLGRLEFSRSVSKTYKLADVVQAVDDLNNKVGDPIRLVLVP